VVRDVVALVEREGISVLLVTHDLEEALSLSDEVNLLFTGVRGRHITQHYQSRFRGHAIPCTHARTQRSHPFNERAVGDLSREVDQPWKGA